MSLFGFAFKPRRAKTAKTAKDRLQLLLAHERGSGAPAADFLPQLQADLLTVIRKYVKVEDDDVEVKMQREDGVSSLEINVEMPARDQAEKTAETKADAKADAGKDGAAEAKPAAKDSAAAGSDKSAGGKSSGGTSGSSKTAPKARGAKA